MHSSTLLSLSQASSLQTLQPSSSLFRRCPQLDRRKWHDRSIWMNLAPWSPRFVQVNCLVWSVVKRSVASHIKIFRLDCGLKFSSSQFTGWKTWNWWFFFDVFPIIFLNKNQCPRVSVQQLWQLPKIIPQRQRVPFSGLSGNEFGSLSQLCEAAGGSAGDPQDPDLQQWNGRCQGEWLVSHFRSFDILEVKHRWDMWRMDENQWSDTNMQKHWDSGDVSNELSYTFVPFEFSQFFEAEQGNFVDETVDLHRVFWTNSAKHLESPTFFDPLCFLFWRFFWHNLCWFSETEVKKQNDWPPDEFEDPFSSCQDTVALLNWANH